MEAKELRVGNYYNWRGGDAPDEGYDEVFKIQDYIDIENNPHWFRPILIEEEWLLKLGFKKVNDNHFILEVLNRGRINCYLRDNFEVDIELGNKSGYSFGYPKVDFLHQLQNLYHSLTGEEL